MNPDAVDLYWIPLGAGPGGGLVRLCGRIYEAIAARLARRPRCALFHSAMIVTVDGGQVAIEMAPAWSKGGDRGVVSEGPVGARLLGRSRLFRYEIRRWVGGSIPDLAEAVGGPVTISTPSDAARRVVELVPDFPTLVWGRDELEMGDMWNSNSLVSWLLVLAEVDLTDIAPPQGGRAPGWDAGVRAAIRSAGGASGGETDLQ